MTTRAKTNDDSALVIEVDVDLDVLVTLVFVRANGPLSYRGALCEHRLRDGRVARVMYAGDVPAKTLRLAKDRAIDACAEHDRAPTTEREP